VPTVLGIALSVSNGLHAEDKPASGDTVARAVTAESLMAEANAAQGAGDMVRARELLRAAIERDPAHVGARSALAVVESQLTGTPPAIVNDPVGGDLHAQAALAEARMQLSRAELLAAGARFEDAIVLLAQSRVALLPHRELPAAEAEIQRIDAMLGAYRERHLMDRDHSARENRQAERVDAETRARHHERTAASLFAARIARVKELENKAFYESALAACRRLRADYPDNKQVEELYARLLAGSHRQRDLSIAEQREELLEETRHRLENSLIPSGFDGWPSFPADWAERHAGRSGLLDAPTTIEPWEEALGEKLATRLSFDLVEQNAVEVLNALARQAGINLVIDPSVLAAGDRLVTLKANDITFRNTLSWICRLTDTTWHLSKGAVFIGGTQDTQPVLAVYDVGDLLFAPKDQPGKQIAFGAGGGGGAGAGTGGFNLFQPAAEEDAAPAITPEDLVDLIQQAVSPAVWQNEAYGISIRGTTLLVTAPNSTHLLIQQFIRSQSNLKNQLVRVSARWLTISDGYLEEIGVDWRSPDLLSLPYFGNAPGAQFDGMTGFHRGTSNFDHTGGLTNNLPAASTIPNPATAATGLNLQATLVNAVQASAIISAVERNRKGTILEAPELVTISGVRANTFMGSQFAFVGDYTTSPPAGTLDGTLDPEISVINLGASLDVKPYVSADGKYVFMEFRPAIASLQQLLVENILVPRFYPTGNIPGGAGGVDIITGVVIINSFPMELPNILVREVSTYIRVPDGGTMLVGGFGKMVEQTMSAKIPFLGHIPFLGRLFGKRGRYSDRYQLYLMADVHIINYAELEAKL
jgi:hypothetical protein